MNGFFLYFTRERLSANARLGDHLAQAAFFVMLASLFPLTVGPAADGLRLIGPAVIWIAALLSALPAFDRLFCDDLRSGWLEQASLSRFSLYSYIAAKLVCWYLFALLPLIVITPLLMIFFMMPLALAPVFVSALALGLGVLVLLGSIAGSLTLGARRAAMLVALLILPLAIPLLVFGVLGCQATVSGDDMSTHFSLLSAFFLFLLVISPPATAAGLRSALEDG